MCIPDERYAQEILLRIGYFQLINGYKYPYKDPVTKRYIANAAFNDIVALYEFDEKQRHLFLRQLLYVERSLKTRIAYHFCEMYGDAQATYLSASSYTNPKAKQSTIDRLTEILRVLAEKNTDYPYINHYRKTYNNVPLWVIVNGLTFGNISIMFSVLPQSLQSRICKHYPLYSHQMEKFLSVLTKFRNVCAHGERLFSYTTKDDVSDLPIHLHLSIPKNGTQYCYGKRDLFAVVIALRYLLPEEQYTAFAEELSSLLCAFFEHCTVLSPTQFLRCMHFPDHWHEVTTCAL